MEMFVYATVFFFVTVVSAVVVTALAILWFNKATQLIFSRNERDGPSQERVKAKRIFWSCWVAGILVGLKILPVAGAILIWLGTIVVVIRLVRVKRRLCGPHRPK